ncbi:Integrase catalytic region [Ammonifex degensii KC4]|uniref:Integrase catalytic region n=1 Tax=Ammonifex degensii (strain DSM 10501 / KC4) TaxID=429009 RepID=C9R7M0_AMMDK|nr:integrase core domain-containing protein [Ammonifex degensii]ACX52299.1 Integrase catalytic region [Ammonifex degensii KC4]
MTLYQQLKRSGNPQAIAQTVASLLTTCSPKEVARIMGCSVRWIYKLRKRLNESGGNLSGCILPRGPKKRMPNRTPQELEALVVKLAQETNLGPKRLASLLYQSLKIKLSPYTIRNILKRHHIRCRKRQSKTGSRKYWTDVQAFAPFSFWQVDVKHIADKTTLPAAAYSSILKNRLPRYQFTAIDVRTRVRFIAFAYSLSFANGIAFLVLLANWLKTFGLNQTIFIQTDNGSEFGGPPNSRKRKLMSLIFSRLDCQLLNIPAGRKEANGYVERSHRTDDEEFYIPYLAGIRSQKDFLISAQRWILYYNYQRPHLGRELNGKTPMEIATSLSHYHPAIGAMPVVVLDHLAPHIFDAYKLSTLPWDYPPKNESLAVNETLAQYTRLEVKEGAPLQAPLRGFGWSRFNPPKAAG